MKYVLLAFVSLLFVSCLPDSKLDKETQPVDYKVQNEKEITDYIAKNKLTALKSDTGLYYVINEAGTGKQPAPNSNVTVAYKGYYTNGTGFDQSSAAGIDFNLQGVIKGWTEGIQYFKEGGNGVLLVPAHLGYGSYNYSGIPGGSVLVFDVKLITVR